MTSASQFVSNATRLATLSPPLPPSSESSIHADRMIPPFSYTLHYELVPSSPSVLTVRDGGRDRWRLEQTCLRCTDGAVVWEMAEDMEPVAEDGNGAAAHGWWVRSKSGRKRVFLQGEAGGIRFELEGKVYSWKENSIVGEPPLRVSHGMRAASPIDHGRTQGRGPPTEMVCMDEGNTRKIAEWKRGEFVVEAAIAETVLLELLLYSAVVALIHIHSERALAGLRDEDGEASVDEAEVRPSLSSYAETLASYTTSGSLELVNQWPLCCCETPGLSCCLDEGWCGACAYRIRKCCIIL
ncbi:uncharacterized protein VTP21DRAFT_7622 [Calcarisporiella thermophila]|uniref:uncharacterized protein n=1 Tax=Calcarisporiella thermophila TaxID=911321 RepID=UPI0037447741